jgi:hypothetical protein
MVCLAKEKDLINVEMVFMLMYCEPAMENDLKKKKY